MTEKIEVIYKIKVAEKSYETNVIESNLKEDTVRWDISKSISDKLISESAALKPERLVLQYAEMQKRGLQIEIESLDDLELTIKTKTEKISQMLDAVLDEQVKVFEDKKAVIYNKVDEFENSVRNSVKEIKQIHESVANCQRTLDSLSLYKMQEFVTTIQNLVELNEKHPDLIKFAVKQMGGKIIKKENENAVN